MTGRSDAIYLFSIQITFLISVKFLDYMIYAVVIYFKSITTIILIYFNYYFNFKNKNYLTIYIYNI